MAAEATAPLTARISNSASDETRGPPSTMLMAANAPATVMSRPPGPVAPTSRAVSAPATTPRTMRGASGPRTSPKARLAEAARSTPGSAAGGIGARLNGSNGR